MILIGHADIQSSPFFRILDCAAISKTPSHATLFCDYNVALCRYAHEHGLTLAVHVRQIKELILAHAMKVSYLVVDKSLVLNAQKIADDYLFDAKILLLSDTEDDIEFAALNSIDGILFASAIVG